MTGNDLMAVLKSPIAKIVFLVCGLLAGVFFAIGILTRDEDPRAVTASSELTEEEKRPMTVDTGIRRYREGRGKAEKVKEAAPGPNVVPVPKIAVEEPKKKTEKRDETKKSDVKPVPEPKPIPRRVPLLGEKKPEQANAAPRIFTLSTASGSGAATDNEIWLSENYASYGRLLDCKLVNTLESNVPGTPLIAIVLEDLWWENSRGERKLIIPAGTEVHGTVGGCVRNRLTASGKFILVWQITSGHVGYELTLEGMILEKSNQAGTKDRATVTDMSAGIPGRVMNNKNLDEAIMYIMAFVNGLSRGYESKTIVANGNTVIATNDNSNKNAIATAFDAVSRVALENIAEKISKESYYIRVAAGTEFYLYIKQVTNIEKARIADSALNALELMRKEEEERKKSGEKSLRERIGNIDREATENIKKYKNIK